MTRLGHACAGAWRRGSFGERGLRGAIRAWRGQGWIALVTITSAQAAVFVPRWAGWLGSGRGGARSGAVLVLELWETPAVRPLLLGVVRSATTDPVAAAMLRQLLAEGPFLALARAIDRPDAALRATLAGSQLIGLALARYVVAVEPLASAPPEVLVRALAPTVQRYLAGDLTGAERPADLTQAGARSPDHPAPWPSAQSRAAPVIAPNRSTCPRGVGGRFPAREPTAPGRLAMGVSR